ncbi:GntR family transcriptional regulator [Streptomyces sp. NPDC018029]|uniref:GntR family transcriptional regulator n=1 Tax=Streptomyces sp. NPDC018029 TaxID=3365032 RepID=UPI0037B18A8F
MFNGICSTARNIGARRTPPVEFVLTGQRDVAERAPGRLLRDARPVQVECMFSRQARRLRTDLARGRSGRCTPDLRDVRLRMSPAGLRWQHTEDAPVRAWSPSGAVAAPVEITASSIRREDVINVGGSPHRVVDLIQLPGGAKQVRFETGDLRNQITASELKAGERLPPETTLASRYGVSTSTLRSAMALLQSEGLVEKTHGKGNFVSHASRRHTYVGGGRKHLETSGIGSTLRVTVHTTRLQAQGPLIPLLRVPPNTELIQFLCIHNEGTSPHSLARIYVPYDLPPKGPPCEPPSCQAFGTRLAEYCPPSAQIRERLTARLPTHEEADTLRIGSTLAVLDITRVTIDSTGRVIEAALLVLPSHRADA